MATPTPRGNIRFVAVGRKSDGASSAIVVASHVFYTSGALPAKYAQVCNKVLQSDKVQEYSRLTITDREVGTLHYDSDKDCVYLAVTSSEYPQRTVFKFLDEVKKGFAEFHDSLHGATDNSLTKVAKKTLTALCAKYDNLEQMDKVAGVQAQVNDVTNIMKDNVNKMLENNDKLQDLDTKADNLRNEAHSFKKNATNLKKAMCWQNYKLTIIIVIVVCALIGILVGMICALAPSKPCAKSSPPETPTPAPTPAPSQFIDASFTS